MRRHRPIFRGPDGVESSLLRLLADLGVVIGAVTAVLYYFGWVRTRFQARQLGFDVSALNLGTADYLLKSLNVLFVPLVLLLAAWLVLHQAHRQFIVPVIQTRRRATVLRIARLLGWAWVPLFVVAVLLLFTPLNGYALPLCLTLAILCAAYGRWIRRNSSGADPWSLSMRLVVLALLILAVFWGTERVARTAGNAFGADIAANPHQLPALIVFSAEDLRLDGPGVSTTAMREPNAAYEFRYAGLFLLERSGDRYFLITDDPGRVIVLRETGGVRMEFFRLDERS